MCYYPPSLLSVCCTDRPKQRFDVKKIKIKKGTERTSSLKRATQMINELAIKKINLMYVQVKYTGQRGGVELPCRNCCSTTQEKKKNKVASPQKMMSEQQPKER